MVTLIWVNIGSGDVLLPDGTKPLPQYSAVVKPKFMGRPPDHPWWINGSPKSFLGCWNYFDFSLKDICFFQLLKQSWHVFCFNHVPTYRELVRLSGDFRGHVGSPDREMGRIWQLGGLLSAVLGMSGAELKFTYLKLHQNL